MKTILVKAALLLAGLVLAVGLGEVIAWLLEAPSGDVYESRHWPAGPRDRYRITGDALGWEPMPNVGGPDDPFAHNALGLRDRPAQEAKPAGTRRILVLGDSVAYGPGLDLHETFDNQLERMLTERLGQPVEALNMSVPGYNSIQEKLLFERRGLALDPDMVIVAWATNDYGVTPAIVVSGDEVFTAIPGDVDLPVLFSLPPAAQVWLLRHSALFRLLSRRGAALAASCAGEAEVETLALGTSENRLALYDIARLASEHGAGTLFVLFPAFAGSPDDEARLEETAGFLASSGLAHVDLRKVFSGQPAHALRHFPDDHMHPSLLASRLAAEAVAERVVRDGFGVGARASGPGRLPTDRRPTDAESPEPRFYIAAQTLGPAPGAFNQLVERYPDPEGDTSAEGPDIVAFAAGRCGAELCLQLRLARPAVPGDRLGINFAAGAPTALLTIRPGLNTPPTLALRKNPEVPIEVALSGTPPVYRMRLRRDVLPPPFDTAELLKVGEAITWGTADAARIVDKQLLMVEFVEGHGRPP